MNANSLTAPTTIIEMATIAIDASTVGIDARLEAETSRGLGVATTDTIAVALITKREGIASRTPPAHRRDTATLKLSLSLSPVEEGNEPLSSQQCEEQQFELLPRSSSSSMRSSRIDYDHNTVNTDIQMPADNTTTFPSVGNSLAATAASS